MCPAPRSVLNSAIVAGLCLAPAAYPAAEETVFDRAPYLQSLTSSSVLIVSQTVEPLRASIRWGPTPRKERSIEEPEETHEHVFALEGLRPQTVYHYQVVHGRGETFPPASFRTLPEPGGELLVAVIGDSGSLSDAQFRVRDRIGLLAPDLLLHTGDLAYPFGTPLNYQSRFFCVYEEILARTCVYPSLGNHDCLALPNAWIDAFHLPEGSAEGGESYYSFDAGDAHLVALNTCTWSLPVEQVDWLEEDLDRSERIWKIVYFHHAVYSNGAHGGNLEVRDVVEQALEIAQVDLVLCGHDHTYERFFPLLEGRMRDAYQEPHFVRPRGVVYVVTGGGGASLYPYVPGRAEAPLSAAFRSTHHALSLRIGPERLVAEAISPDGEILDAFTITKRGERPSLRFRRGDVNASGGLEVADAVAMLGMLFRGRRGVCAAAADVNGSGAVSIADAVYLLGFLFRGGASPPTPHPGCGVVEGADDTGCRTACPGA